MSYKIVLTCDVCGLMDRSFTCTQVPHAFVQAKREGWFEVTGGRKPRDYRLRCPGCVKASEGEV